MSLFDVLSPKKVLAAVVLGTAAMALPASAQQAPPNPGQPGQPGQPGGAGGGGRGNRGNPAQFRQRMEERLKEALDVKDDAEWKAIQPKIEKVQQLQRDARGGGGFGRGGRGGNGGPGGGNGGPGGGNPADTAAPSPVQAASQALRQTLDNKSASPDEIKAKLTALREARAKSQTDLKSAQEDLKSVLTARQEAVLVTYGMLE